MSEQARRAAVDVVLMERDRQEAKRGEQNHPIVSLDAQRGYVMPEVEAVRLLLPWAAMARENCEREHRAGRGTYTHILVEEVAEMVEAASIHGDASDEARAEAVQAAAVALAIVERIDRARAAKSRAMSEQTGEMWAVVDADGVRHDVAVEAGRGSPPPSWWAKRADGVARRSPDGARAAVLQLAYACGWDIAEVLSPGQVSRDELAAEVAYLEARRGALLAEVDRLRGEAAARAAAIVGELRGFVEDARRYGAEAASLRAAVASARLDGAREMLDLVLAVALNAGSPQSTIDALLALPLPEGFTPEQRSRADAERKLNEMSSEVVRLQAAWARSEEAIALVLRIQSADDPSSLARELGVRLGYPLLADVAIAAARASDKEKVAAWGPMPTAEAVALHCEGRAEPTRGGPWRRLHSDERGERSQILYLSVLAGRVVYRYADSSVWLPVSGSMLKSQWKPLDK